MAKDGEKGGMTIIIKKKKRGGHAAAHGGAWKVAYADFVTAMMAFFMVMWLMGSDEVTKAMVQSYFEGKKMGTESLNPNGALGGGDASHKEEGGQGGYEEKFLERPHFTAPVQMQEQQVLKDLSDAYDGAAFTKDVDGDLVKFEVIQRIYFAEGSAELPSDSAQRNLLARLGDVFRSYEGQIIVEGYSDGGQDWALAWNRSMAVRSFLMAEHKVNPDKMFPAAGVRAPAGGQVEAIAEKDRRSVRFLLKRNRNKQ